jgi:hypothetical protein
MKKGILGTVLVSLLVFCTANLSAAAAVAPSKSATSTSSKVKSLFASKTSQAKAPVTQTATKPAGDPNADAVPATTTTKPETKKTTKPAVTQALPASVKEPNTQAIQASTQGSEEAVSDASADVADKSSWSPAKGLAAIKAALLSIYNSLKQLVNRDNYTPSHFALTTTIPFAKMVEGIPNPTIKTGAQAVLKSVLKKGPDGKWVDPVLALKYDFGFSGAGVETPDITNYLESLPEEGRTVFIPADPSVGFPPYVMGTFEPKPLNMAIEAFFALLSKVSDGNNGFQDLYLNIARVRGDTIFWQKMIFLLSMQRNSAYFKDMSLIKQMEFTAFEVMLLMSRLSNTIDDEKSTRGPNFDENKPAAAGYTKIVRYTDPFGTVDRLLKQFHLESLFDPANPDSIKKDMSATQYLKFRLSQAKTDNKAKLAVANVYQTPGGLPARIKAAKTLLPAVLTENNKADGELNLFQRQYLVYSLYDMCAGIRYVQAKNESSSKKISKESAAKIQEENTKKMIQKVATDFGELVEAFQKAYQALGDYELSKDFIDKCLPSLRNGLTITAKNISKQLNDMLETLKRDAAAIAKTGDVSLIGQRPTVPEAAFDTTGQVPVPALDWLRIKYAQFSKILIQRFEFDSGYVPEYLKISYGDALQVVFAMGFRVVRDLAEANRLYMKTPEYAQAKAEILDPMKVALASLTQAMADAQKNNDAAALKELKTKQLKLKASIILANNKLKGKAIMFKYPRVKSVDPKTKAVTVIKEESIQDFMIRELIKLFNRMPESTRQTVIQAMNRFTMSFGIDMNTYFDDIAAGEKSEADKQAEELAEGNEELESMFAEEPADDSAEFVEEEGFGEEAAGQEEDFQAEADEESSVESADGAADSVALEDAEPAAEE